MRPGNLSPRAVYRTPAAYFSPSSLYCTGARAGEKKTEGNVEFLQRDSTKRAITRSARITTLTRARADANDLLLAELLARVSLFTLPFLPYFLFRSSLPHLSFSLPLSLSFSPSSLLPSLLFPSCAHSPRGIYTLSPRNQFTRRDLWR